MTTDVVHITSGELATQLGVDTSTIRRWVNSGKLIPHITTPGGHHRFLLEDALAALAPRRQTPGTVSDANLTRPAGDAVGTASPATPSGGAS